MRRQLIEALSYPAIMVRQLIEAGNYPHASLYAATGQRCHKCDGEHACGWDACLQDFRRLDERTTEFLAETLREGIKLVEALNSELMHDETTCNCVTCRWIRDAEHLVEESELHLPHVEPAIVARADEELVAE
ncbi:MAG: hypothetical protein OEW35_15700 [Gammaproteobacteria bacterium]|nr:hypothetical protein [Gammaproteobacteria bacterium]MDH4256912.1 hypothetical protein [Gammaproteobacteria bacterium]MDH5311425.1 hypothetical protein [Gammaproteobacteria bacterium]